MTDRPLTKDSIDRGILVKNELVASKVGGFNCDRRTTLHLIMPRLSPCVGNLLRTRLLPWRRPLWRSRSSTAGLNSVTTVTPIATRSLARIATGVVARITLIRFAFQTPSILTSSAQILDAKLDYCQVSSSSAGDSPKASNSPNQDPLISSGSRPQAEKPADRPPPEEWFFTIHSTFILGLILFILEHRTLELTATTLAMTISFAFVVHEFARALIARRNFGTPLAAELYPFGAIWRKNGRPISLATEISWREIIFALVGPFANLFVAALLILVEEAHDPYNKALSSFLHIGALAQIGIGCLSLLPIVPLDGGILIRAMLHHSSPQGEPYNLRIKALTISRWGVLAFLFLAVGAGEGTLAAIALYLFYTVVRLIIEESSSKAIEGKVVAEYMRPLDKLDCLPHGASLRRSLHTAACSFQDFFPVVHARQLIGFVSRESLIKGRMSEAPDTLISDLIDRDFLTVKPGDILKSAMPEEMIKGLKPVAVMNNGDFVGVILPDRSLEVLLMDEVANDTKSNFSDQDDLLF